MDQMAQSIKNGDQNEDEIEQMLTQLVYLMKISMQKAVLDFQQNSTLQIEKIETFLQTYKH